MLCPQGPCYHWNPYFLELNEIKFSSQATDEIVKCLEYKQLTTDP